MSYQLNVTVDGLLVNVFVYVVAYEIAHMLRAFYLFNWLGLCYRVRVGCVAGRVRSAYFSGWLGWITEN